MSQVITGNLRKMRTEPGPPVQYMLRIGDRQVALNECIGSTIRLHYTGRIHCVACGRPTRKSYSQGHCYPCMRRLASCDQCIVRPELCHYHEGTCREPQWGEAHCLQPHVVYVANSSGPKVGITRASQLPTRWLDQGAVQALALLRVSSRRMAGLAEVVLKAHITDRTDWRAMLRSRPADEDLAACGARLLAEAGADIERIAAAHGERVEALGDTATAQAFDYPVQQYPARISALTLDRQADITGELQGIKGQYLMLDAGVLNVRRHSGYEVTFDAG